MYEYSTRVRVCCMIFDANFSLTPKIFIEIEGTRVENPYGQTAFTLYRKSHMSDFTPGNLLLLCKVGSYLEKINWQ